MLNPSSEAVVVTEQGLAIKTRAANCRIIPESERWDSECEPFRGLPDGKDSGLEIQVGVETSRRALEMC